ncbi:phosphoenolpyruvate carboxylase, partial [bacterium]|nr:phosphoenolpyruvate carboxylase [bacterium]
MKQVLGNSKALRANVSLLGKALGDCLKKREGKKAFELVEEVRNLSILARKGDARAIANLQKKLNRLSVDQKALVLKAFNQFLNLANVAEQQQRIRRKRSLEQRNSKQTHTYSLEQSFADLKKKGFSKSKIFDTFVDQDIELVFTAHPTEVLRRSVIHKQHAIAKELSILDTPDLTKWEEIESRQGLERNIHALWLTDEVRRLNPTPRDEAQWGMTLVEDTLWRAVPRHLKKLTRLLRDSTGRELPIRRTPLRISSW